MANFKFPDVSIVDSRLWLVHPGQKPHVSPYTGGYQVARRSGGHWRGVLVFGFLGASLEDQKTLRKIESFAARLEGMVNTTDAPIFRPSGGNVASGLVCTFNGERASSGGGIAKLLWSKHVEKGRLKGGDYVRIGNRLHILLLDMQARRTNAEIVVRPRIDPLPPIGTPVVWEDVTVRCRVANLSVWGGAEVTPEWKGPWEMEWVEEV